MKRAFILLCVAGVLAACGGAASEPDAAAPEESGLTAAQLEHGIGPVSSVQLGAIDPALAAEGEEVFTVKCSACHKMSDRYVGPPLGKVTESRSPGFIMNMMLNPAEMVEKHPAVREMLAQYMTAMPNQQLTEADARAVLEYLRAQAQ